MLGSVPTAFAGAFIIRAFGGETEQDSFVKTAIGVALLFTAATYTVRMYLNLRIVTDGGTLSQEDPPVGRSPPSSSARSAACWSASPRWAPAR